MPILIDTNIGIFLTKGHPEVEAKVLALDAPPVMSLITLIELEGGVRGDNNMHRIRRARLQELRRWVDVLPFEEVVAQIYSDMVATLGFSRPRLLDRLIAATAIAADLLLVTSNGPDFVNIPGLKLEVWPRPAQ